MSWTINGALAVPFATEVETFDFSIGVDTYTATLPAGTYRVVLASSSADALRVLAAAMLMASPGLPGGTTVAVSIGDTGLVSITCSAAFKVLTLHLTTMGKVLGFTSALATAATTQTASRAPWYLAFFVGLYGGAWQPRRSGARERTAGGVVYSFAGTSTTYDRELSADLIPWGPTEATEAESPATPMYPLLQYREALGDTSVGARVWSLLDVWTAGQNAGASIGCALTLTWQTARASTTERFDVGSLASDLLEPTRQDERWQRYVSARWSFVLPASGQTGTRA